MNREEAIERLARGPVCLVGVLGGIAAGKSTLTQAFERFGARLFDADRIVHEIHRRPETKAAVRARWGDEVMTPAGEIDRPRLARRVFDDPAERRALEEIVHEPVLAELARVATEMEGALAGPQDPDAPPAVLVVDAALLAETGLFRACRWLFFVDTPREERIRRARAEREWDEGEIDRREAHQMPVEEKRRLAGEIVRGDQGPAAIEERVREFYRSRLGRSPRLST
ncbi:MAG: dephospho-CoA kinase [Planctomycetes bacterium]|nr:dephospho-CoA kinase [Planctomycetota bacterium]